jgi:putative sterol carrier protein
VACINRYWGWYSQSGQIDAGAEFLGQELNGLCEQLGKPIVLTEFGADTIAGMHSDPPEMWTEEYQVEFLRAYLDVAAERPFVAGMHVWNFADFKTGQSSRRPAGLNLKGVFTRDRRPKMAAHMLRERWVAQSRTAAHTERAARPAAKARAPEHGLGSLDELLGDVAQKLSGQEGRAPKTIGIDVDGEGLYRLVFDAEGRCTLERGEGQATATLKMSADTAGKLFAGALNPMVAMTTGQVKVEGDVRALMALQSLR